LRLAHHWAVSRSAVMVQRGPEYNHGEELSDCHGGHWHLIESVTVAFAFQVTSPGALPPSSFQRARCLSIRSPRLHALGPAVLDRHLVAAFDQLQLAFFL
jgi:hypothetical protein